MAAEGSGRGRRARFTVTCALLQRYMRENQRRAQAGNNNLARLLPAPPSPLPVAVAPPMESGDARRTTMQLFPARAAGGGAAMAQAVAAQQRPEVMMRAPMTIFYRGQVIKVDNVPFDKGNQLLQMVARSSVNAPPPPPEVVVVDVPEDDDEPEVVDEPSAAGANHQQATLARKASLERFLRKRKRRVNGGVDPDHNEDAWPPAKKMDAGETLDDVPDALWLRL
ncbi:unnamed protein product [Urochloa humidicola]